MTTLWDQSLELIEDADQVLVFHQIAGPSPVITLGEKEGVILVQIKPLPTYSLHNHLSFVCNCYNLDYAYQVQLFKFNWKNSKTTR